MGLNGKQLLENFKEDEAYGNTTYTPPADEDSNDDNAWKYISAGDISGLADYTNRNYNYRTIPFLGQIVGHAADAATQGVADVAQFVGAQGVGDYLNEKAQEGEAELPAMSTPELSLAYLTDPNGLASAFGMMAGSMLSMAPVAAIAPELLPARATMALSKVPKALSAVPKIGGALEEMAPMAGRFALTGPVEAMMEGGNTEREMLQNGATPEEARQAAWNVFGENVGLLTATNALEGGLLGKIKIRTPHFSNPVVNTASRVAGYVPTTAAEMALQGYEEGAQQGIQNGVEGESPNTANQILNPFAWTDDQWDAAKLGVAGAVPLMGAMGAIRHFGNRGDNGSTAADSLLDQAQDDIDSITSQAAQQSVIQSAQQDMENNPYTAPTATQDTSYEAPSDTSSGSSYDASALEGDPQYTVSGEVSSTDVTPLTDQKMRLLDAAYYNKYGQHLFVTSMKRNGDGGSWHDSGQAFDTADDNLENNKEARDWLISEGEKLGLTPLDEYEHPSAGATGGHIHFSDHGEPIPDGISVGESDSDMDDNDADDSTGGVDLSNLPVGDIAMAIAQNTNLPVNFIWSQLSHESDGGKSKLAVEDHNYGGVKGTDGNYLHFDNDQQFIDYMSKYYPKYREDGIYDAKTADQFAEALQHGGYFTADLGEYEGGMHRYLEQAGLSQDAMSSGKARRAGSKGGDSTSSTPDLSGSFEISADDPAMDSMFASFAKDWQNMSTDANEINFFGDMFNSRNKFKATEENKQAILDNYGDAFRQYVQENQPQTVQATQTTQAPAQPKQAPQPQRIEMQTPNLDKAKTQQNAQQPTQGAQMPTVPQESPRKTVNNLATARLNNMLSEIPGDSFKKLDHIQKLAYLMTARYYANAVGSAQANNHIDSIISKVRRAAGFNGDGVTDGMNNAQKNAFYQSYTQQAYDAALDLRRNATDDTPTNLQKLDNAIQFLQQEVKKNSAPAKAAKTSTPAPRTVQTAAQAPKQTAILASIPDNAIAAAKQADDGFSAPLNIFSANEQKAFRSAGLVYRDSNYNGTERVKTAPLYEEGDRRMNGVEAEPVVKAQTAGKADKYKKAAKSDTATKPREKKVTDSGNQILNGDTVDAVLKAQGDGVPSNLADYVRGVTREDVASIPDKRKNFIDEAIDTGAFRAIETDRGGYMLIGTKGGMFSSVTELTPAETVYYAMHGGLDFNKRSTKEAIMDDLATWYGSEKSREIKSQEDNSKEAQESVMGSDAKNTTKESSIGEPIHGIKGTETTVVTDSGKEIRVRYLVVPASRVITSHDAETMTPNKAYPQELQPRDRQRVSMQEQVTTMANELRPADLGAGRNLNQGAPIIRKDGVVLNGNGRAMAIQKATAAGGDKATAYRKYIFEHSKDFGLSRVNLAQVRKYMLVREVVDDIDADTMQDIIGSTAGGSRMGASEQAKADAKKIRPRELIYYVDNEQGDMTTAANQDFVARVLYRIVGKNERNAYTDEHGNVNADGIQRVKRALFSLAYNDNGLIDKMAESTDDNIRNVSRGLMSAAPAFARVNLAVKDGQAYEYDAAKTISDAVKHLDALRREGKPVKDYLNEQSMFSEYQDTDEVREVLRFLDENKRSGKKIGIFLNDMARSVLEQGSPNQTSLMDGGRATLGEIIKAAERVARDGTTAANLFDNVQEESAPAEEIRTQEESDATSDIQNANAASTEDRSVETNPHVLSYKRKAQEIVSSFEKRKVNLTDARQEIKDLMAKANEERWGQKMSNDECMAAQGFLSDALSKLNAKQAKKRKARKSIAKAKAEEKSNESIFGSVEDADKEMLDALGLSEEDLADDVLTAPDGIKNTAEERERLEKELSAELNKMSAMPMFNPKIYTLGLKLAMTYVKDGINTVKKLVAKLNATFGDKIGPWAPALAETVRTWPKGVPFDEKKVMAISKAVGARYENGITSLDGMQADMKKLLKGQHKSFAPMIEASYNGIKKFFDEKEAQSHGDESRQEKSESTDAGREGQQSATAEGAGAGRTESRNVSGAEGGESKISRGRDSGSAERENPERTEPSGVRAGTELEETAGNGTRKRGTEKPVLTEAQKNPSPEETPGHDYEIKPSKTKKTPAVRFKQNIAAIKLLKQLEAENRLPTPKEQAVLGNYNGWGGLKDAFLDTKENKELRAVLTPEEYEAAKSTINDAFYTPADIVQAVWKGVSRLGFNGGRVLDPSMGTGNFFGCMPRDMMKKSSLRGIEIDDLTSRFARMLYPSALVEHTGFEKASLADNFYDLVISNIPFDANHSIAGYKIHNYFFAHGMDKVRLGGLMVYITSQGSLTNSQDGARMREYIGKKADMVAAYKLPSGAFGESGTNVGTDIVIFRKRGENEMKPSYAQDFQHLTKMFTQTNWRGDMYGGVTVNKYFKDHPENIIGKASSGRDQYGNDVMQVKPSEGANIAKDLAKAMNKLPKDIYKPINRTGKGPFDTIKANFKARADEKTRDFEYYEKDGKIYQNQDGTAVEVGAGNKLKRLKGYLKVKNALNSLMLAEMDPNAKESTVDKLRKQLNTAYDTFVKQNGYLNDPTVQRAYIDDPSAGMVMALEKVEYTGIGAKKKIKSVEKMGIFKERAIAPIQEVKSVKTPNDALIVSLRNKGGVDLPYMAQLMGSNPETVVAGLEGQIFKNPVTEAYETRDEYLSGNVREKLAQAENAAAQDPSYQRNVDELKKVIPKDLIADEICVTMGAPWIPASDVQAFADRITGRAGALSIKFIPSGAKWIVDGYGSNSKYKTQGISLANLLSDILNNKAIEVYSGKGKERRLDQAATDAANVVAADMKEDFTSWLWSDKDRTKRLTRYYNDNYNNTVLREYDGSHLVFDGMNEKIQLRPHQKNVVWRMLQGGNTLIAHCVGAGKTFEMQAAGMEMRRLGIANKPLYILPNNVVEQFTKEFRQLYPDVNLLVLQNDYKSRPGYIPAVPKSTVEQTIKREDGRKETITIPFGKLSAADRKKVLEARAMRTRTLTQIRTGDWDGIIMSHSQFERLPLSPETAGSIIREQLDEVEQAIVEAKNGNVGKKDLSTIENQKKKLEDKLKDILKTDLRDIGIPFEQLGVDQIFVDEADMFKNLHYTTSMDRVNGLPNSNANRSMDMYAKTRWLTNANNGRGVVFATGTPVSNTMAEMYTMMRYLDFRGLKEKGLNLFDNWLRTFGEIGSGIERNPSGNGFRKVTKVLRFINMPELTKMFRKFVDVKTQDDLDLDIPDLKNGKPTIVKIAPDPVLTDYIRNVVPKRIAAMAKRREDMHKGSDNMLKLTGDLRKMSITDSKIDALADAVAEKYEDTSDVKGAQLIFCDQGIPKAEKDNATDSLVEEDDKDAEADNAGVYKKIITALQERGIPENQIVFIQSAKNKAQMDAIFEKVDKGDIRILIGSTQKMGAGTNCQHHLVALHDLDAPWRPRDLEQRHGRILRQGNPNKEVEIFNYVLQDSFDAVMWEKLKNKAAIVAQAMSNNMQQRTVEDADLVTLTYADAENAGTSDPLVKERITLDSEIKKYKHAQVAFNRKVSTAEATLETAPKEIGLLKSAIEKIKGDIAARQDTSGDNFRMTISGKEYVERKAAQEELGKVLAKLSSKTSVKIGEIGGFDVKAYVSGGGEAHIQLVRGRAYMANTATVRGVESALHKAPETMLKAREIELSRNENNLKEAKEIVGQKNPYAEKLATMEKRFKEINRQIEDNLLGNAKKEETEAPNEETSYSAEEESGAQERALSDIKQEVASAFPNAKNVRDNGHEVLFSMPNGAEVSVSIVPSIEVTESEESNVRAAHGLAKEARIKINGKERTVGSKAIIELSQLGRNGTAYHEAFHAVYDMCLTDKEKAALHKAYDKEAKERDVYEVMADKYRDWMIAKQKGQHTLYGKLWQKVKDASARLARVVRGTDNTGDVFRKVASGEAWERPYNEVESDTRYAAEQKGAQSFIKAAASKLGKRMGVKSDKIITEEAKAKEGIGILDYLIASPSRVATRVKSFRQFYRMGVRAMDVLTERRSYYQRKLGKAMQLVKSKNDYEELTDILLSGDAEGKEWTKEELIQSGTKENVAEAYTRIRRLMRQAYKMVNEAHKHPKTYSKRLSNSKIEELRQNPFVKIMKIHDEEDDGRRLVTYREFANYEHTLEGVMKQALDEMRADEDMQVLEATKQADGTYKVRVREGRGDVTNRKGYIPHFFHNYMVEVRDEDGNYVTTTTSGRTQREAVKKAEEWMKDNKLEDGQKIYIHPKIFDFTRYGMSEKGIVQLGDKDFYALMNRVAKDNDMSLEEAKDLLQNVHQKNRHRFFGNVLHRKGVSGFETDMNYVLSHYFNSASRYYAMETEFKPQAISLYERLFGDFAKDSKSSLAQYVKDYINDVNGTPSALERGVNDALMRSKVYRDFVVSHYGERAVLQLSSNIAGATTYMCLGYFNVSSALLNLTQVMNSAAYIGDVSALGKCLSKGMHRKYSLHDLKVLRETNVLNDIGLDSGSGYDVNRMSAKSLLGKINKAGMSFFKVSEQTVRIGTVLAAYESGIKRGMSHEEAIDFAKEVNQKSNFNYSVADAPNIFRRGSFLSQLALQFKKYGIKELEVMADMCSPRTSRKQKLIFWGTYLLAAGLCGLPALDWLDEVLGWVFGKSPKLAAQEAIMEAAGGTPVGKFIGRMAMYGLPSSLVGVDLSNRVGLSDVVPTELKNFLPPLATKIPQFMQDIFSEAKINAVRDFSPAIYNQIAAWGTGKSYDKRGRINAEYNTFYDKLLRSIGFKSTDERVDSDIRRITSERRSELNAEKQKAVDAYIAHPTPQNMKKLNDLGVKDSTVKKERERKKEDIYNRTKGGMTKKEAQENQQLLNFK